MILNNYIEHTLLKPDAKRSDVEGLIWEALRYKFFGICINPKFVSFAKDKIQGKDLKIITVVNFPLGANHINTTLAQVSRAIEEGADEIDTVISIGDVKEGRWERVKEEISLTKEACMNHNLKVILETDLLSRDEIERSCEVVALARADFVKTSTGFVKNGAGATVENVKFMWETVKSFGLKVKAAGGIKTREKAIDLINAGATRLGTSSGVELVKEN